MTGFELKEAKTELEFVKDRFYDFPKETNVSNSINNIQNAIKSIEELEEYYAIGTVEECREARERQRGKKPVKDEYNHDCCPNCGWVVYQEEWGGRYLPHCENCGQAISWEGEE